MISLRGIAPAGQTDRDRPTHVSARLSGADVLAVADDAWRNGLRLSLRITSAQATEIRQSLGRRAWDRKHDAG